MDCIFCKIAHKELAGQLIYEDDVVVAFNDISPVAPIHILVIPKKHIASLLDLTTNDNDLVSHIMTAVVPQLAKQAGMAEKGFRLVVNTNEDGGQTVNHLHFHLIGGRAMQWPPG